MSQTITTKTKRVAMEPRDVKVNLNSGKFITTENLNGKSQVWKHFRLVVNAEHVFIVLYYSIINVQI